MTLVTLSLSKGGFRVKPRMTLLIQRVFKPYLQLCKINISLFSAFSATTGFLLAESGSVKILFIMTAGVLLLACGASALNQYQERHTDALMERTKDRPVPSGRIRPFHALSFSFLLLIAGLTVLILFVNLSSVLLGVCAIILYNGIYTYLKRLTAFASVPGALIGALLPAIGWIAGGGTFPDCQILAVCFLFYMWQIVHIWLLFLSHGGDYEKAGFPSLTGLFAAKQIRRIVFIWMLATAVTCLLMPLYGLITSRTAASFLIPVVIWFGGIGLKLVRVSGSPPSYQSAFNKMNIYILLIMLLISVDKLKFFREYPG